VLRTETTGGLLLIAAAVAALLWANVWPGAYTADLHTEVGPAALDLHLTLQEWAEDGLLTVFFLVAGIELKRELTVGELRDRRTAVLPVVAALSGVAVPALVCLAINLAAPGGRPAAWAIPTATDIAFALGVLAVVGTHLPSALRAFLLTLAVVDDLVAILVIAFCYSSGIRPWALGLAALGVALFWLLLRLGARGWWWYVPPALAVWTLVHASGVHATIAGVALGMLMPCRPAPGERHSRGERVEHLLRPWSAGVCVPLFALSAAGVPIGGHAVAQVFTEAAPVGVFAGLVLGKSVGVFGGTWLTARFTRAELSERLAWADLFALAVLSGIGFTVSLLITELALHGDPGLAERCKAAVLVGSTASALLAAALLRRRNRHYRSLWDAERTENGMI